MKKYLFVNFVFFIVAYFVGLIEVVLFFAFIFNWSQITRWQFKKKPRCKFWYANETIRAFLTHEERPKYIKYELQEVAK